jgi:hypothetical protein
MYSKHHHKNSSAGNSIPEFITMNDMIDNLSYRMDDMTFDFYENTSSMGGSEEQEEAPMTPPKRRETPRGKFLSYDGEEELGRGGAGTDDDPTTPLTPKLRPPHAGTPRPTRKMSGGTTNHRRPDLLARLRSPPPSAGNGLSRNGLAHTKQWIVAPVSTSQGSGSSIGAPYPPPSPDL